MMLECDLKLAIVILSANASKSLVNQHISQVSEEHLWPADVLLMSPSAGWNETSISCHVTYSGFYI